MKIWKVRIHFITKEIFQYSLITYLILLLAETLKQGLVSFFFNLNILLILVLFNGVVMVITYNERVDKALIDKRQYRIKAVDIGYLIVFTMLGAFLVLYKVQILGATAIVISVLTAIIIIFLSLMIFLDKK